MEYPAAIQEVRQVEMATHQRESDGELLMVSK
jgi:hypothetical protein